MRKLLYLLLLSGCFPMGIPEYFSNQEHAASATGRALIVSDAEFGPSGSLGNQYLLGLFPFTSIFLQHGVDSLLLERQISFLTLKGYEVSITSEDGVALATEVLKPDFVFRSRLNDLSLNAYDAIFLRILRVSGELEVLESSAKSFRVPLDKTSYKKQGQATELALLLEAGLEESMEKFWLEFGLSRPYLSGRRERTALTDGHLVLVNPPKWVSEPTKETQEMFSRSYTYNATNYYAPGILGRVAQRGVAKALAEIVAVENTVESSCGNSWPFMLWHLNTSLQSVEIQGDELVVAADFEILDANCQPLVKKSCRVSMEEKDEFDGSWVYTLESAAQALAGAVFEGGELCRRL